VSDDVDYEFEDGVATIRIDDGKRNALSPAVLRGIYAALDRAQADRAVVILTGREGTFSAGFDLKVMQRGGAEAIGMLRSGYALTARVMAYPYPIMTACNGHAFAMGVFLMLSTDYVIGSRGNFRISANEVAIGMTMPRVAAAVLKNRLSPAAFQRAVALAEVFSVDAAREAGLLDEVVDPAELRSTAYAHAKRFKALDREAHAVSKRRMRAAVRRRIRLSLPLDLVDAIMTGLKMAKNRRRR
jgi:enoyl-CoA hydratase